MNELALFTGAGGGLLATRHLLGFQTVCYVEIATYCVEVLKARIKDSYLDDAPIWDDVRTFNGRVWNGGDKCSRASFPSMEQAILQEREWEKRAEAKRLLSQSSLMRDKKGGHKTV